VNHSGDSEPAPFHHKKYLIVAAAAHRAWTPEDDQSALLFVFAARSSRRLRLELMRQHGRPMLVLECSGNGLIDAPTELQTFLRLPSRCPTLARLHEGGLIHKDIHPDKAHIGSLPSRFSSTFEAAGVTPVGTRRGKGSAARYFLFDAKLAASALRPSS